MNRIYLHRFSQHMTYGTFGVFLDEENIPICGSMELPWRENHTDVSCIPPGEYLCEPEQSKKYKCIIYRLPDEQTKRKGILIHPANLAEEIEGCIVPGTSYDYFRGKPGLLGSGAALAELRKTVNSKPFLLSISVHF